MAIQAAGTLMEGCVLAFLAREDIYGYVLTQRLKETLDVSESTLYPVMRRLQTDNCLTVYDLPHNGRNRRYYRITKQGLDRLDICKKEWEKFKRGIDGILYFKGEPVNG
jgi:PadR family transcriptional regulator PadR